MTLEENIRAILECNFTGYKDEIIDIATKSIMSLSDIENQKTGHWIKDEEMSIVFDIWTCSECGGGGDKHFKYCAHCGAKMKGVNNE